MEEFEKNDFVIRPKRNRPDGSKIRTERFDEIPTEIRRDTNEEFLVMPKRFAPKDGSDPWNECPDAVDSHEGQRISEATLFSNALLSSVDSKEDEIIREDAPDATTSFDDREIVTEPFKTDSSANLLKYLAQRGDIALTKDSTSTDSKQAKSKSELSEFKLEYFDKDGKALTTKEAYKELSRKFHGTGPGSRRIERQLRKESSRTSQLSSSSSKNGGGIEPNDSHVDRPGRIFGMK